jgi:outer membrane biosynthesis protein TonB
VKTKWAKPTKFSAFLKKHRVGGEPALLPEHVSASDPIAVLVHSWLLWESSSEQAATAMTKLVEQRVDFNELRVSLPHEVAGIIGKRYPRVEERLHGIRRTLHDLFLRRHELSFEYLGDKGKRDVKAEIESLDGITPFVSARLLRISFDVHAMPADDQLSALLHESDVIDEPVEPEDLAGWLGTAVKADEAVAAIAAMQAAVDAAWAAGTMTKLVRRHRPLRVVEVVEVVEPVEVEEPVAEPAKPTTTSEKKPAKKSPSKSTAKKTPVSKSSTAKKATTKKATTSKAPSKKAAATAPAKKSTAKKAAKKTAKKATSRSRTGSASNASARQAVGRSTRRSTGSKK